MKTYHHNGEYWYVDGRSLWLRVRQWLIWVGGWETGGRGKTSDPMTVYRHQWRFYIHDYPGKPIRRSPTPVSLFGHRVTFYGWGINMRWRSTLLCWSFRRRGLGGSIGRRFGYAYSSVNGTPSKAHRWFWGKPEEAMTTERQHTLVPCATCGTGDHPKYMVPVGDDWLCPQCAGSQIHTLRTRLSNYERKALVGTLGSEAEADRYLTIINQPSPEPPRPRRKEQP